MTDVAPSCSVPRIATRRLLLRELRVSDFDAYAEHLADPIATTHLSGVLDRRAAWRAFAAATGFWMLNGAGWWGVELTETKELIGTVGAFFRETSPELELGWNLYRRFWRQGFATEAASAARDFAVDRHKARRVIAHIAAGNAASVGVSRNIGMHHEAEVDFYGGLVGRYAMAC